MPSTPRQQIVSEHDLIYQTPPRNWEDGFPIGNGHLGAMIWQPEDPDRIVLGITKLDVWDYRVQQDEDTLPSFERYRHLLQTDPLRATEEVLHEPGYDAPYPAPKPCGRLTIGIDEGFLPLCATLSTQTQRLRLHEAAIECEYELSTRAVRLSTRVDPDGNVLAVRVENTWVHDRFHAPAIQPITLSREIDETLGMPEFGVLDGMLYVRYHFPDGFEYVMGFIVMGAALEKPLVMPDSIRTAVILPNKGELGPVYTVYLTVVTSLESTDILATARLNLKRAEAEAYTDWQARHAAWWAAFWQRSAVELEDRFLEGLWYFSLYQLASTCRGNVAPGLFGLWNMTKTPPWHGDYHGDYNISMAHWYLFSSNHLELGQPYFHTFSQMLPVAVQHARRVYQIDGARYPVATSPRGQCVEMARGIYRMMQVSNAYYVIPFWWHYIYSHDITFLRDVTFPILEETSKYYLALVEEDEGGRLRIGPSWAPEQGALPAYNVNNDLALIKCVWLGYAEACRVLERETPWLMHVQRCLARYPDYPQRNGCFLDSADAPEDLLLAHTGLFSMVYPGEDVDADHPLAEVAASTIDTFRLHAQRQSFVGRESLSDIQAWTTQALCHALLRRPERVDHYLVDVGLSEFLKPNGMLTILSNAIFHSTKDKRAAYAFTEKIRAEHAFVPCANTRRGRDRHFQFLEGPSALMVIINQMLLQSHGGIIRVFPSLPARIGTCAFQNLLAQGAFEVSARCRNGSTERVEIRSLAGEMCTVRLFRYYGTDPVAVTNSAHQVAVEHPSPDSWRFATVPGGMYILTVGAQQAAVEVQPSGQEAAVTWFVDCYGEKIYYGRPDEVSV